MNLPKARKILKELNIDRWQSLPPDHQTAVNLGIEAIKWRELMEHDYGSWCGPPLPGETTENPTPKAHTK